MKKLEAYFRGEEKAKKRGNGLLGVGGDKEAVRTCRKEIQGVSSDEEKNNEGYASLVNRRKTSGEMSEQGWQ